MGTGPELVRANWRGGGSVIAARLGWCAPPGSGRSGEVERSGEDVPPTRVIDGRRHVGGASPDARPRAEGATRDCSALAPANASALSCAAGCSGRGSCIRLAATAAR